LAGGDRVRFFDMPAIEVSSSVIRDRIAERLPFKFLLPERVAHRIAEAGLYREVAA
jgi:nicotinate-nucleotide adenylyltransferase